MKKIYFQFKMAEKHPSISESKNVNDAKASEIPDFQWKPMKRVM